MNEETMSIKGKGLTDFQLKYIAMALMVLDHIEYMFTFTGKIPIWFSWLGRLSAPLFLFCIIQGFIHTHDRKQYFIKIYAIAIVMGLIQFSFYNIGHFMVRPDGFFPQNMMLSTFTILLVILQGIDWCQHKKWVKGLLAIIIPSILPFIAIPFFRTKQTSFIANLLAFSFVPLHSAIADGGTAFIAMGVIMYLLRNHPRANAITFFIENIALYIGEAVVFIKPFNVSSLFTEAYEWMGAFAAIIMLMYNGKRGTGSKKLFYWFYPLHVYILFALSWLVYILIHK
ncbi:MAG: TraX family protein [Lachnospiraceae bacterium]|jgi:multisubunit Na+/H+ antiporter MnhB subunit|nr:TraX family protein [Clostridia bacterium]MDD4525460.1 TraX family protein [Lachnospiraceae bacterium]